MHRSRSHEEPPESDRSWVDIGLAAHRDGLRGIRTAQKVPEVRVRQLLVLGRDPNDFIEHVAIGGDGYQVGANAVVEPVLPFRDPRVGHGSEAYVRLRALPCKAALNRAAGAGPGSTSAATDPRPNVSETDAQCRSEGVLEVLASGRPCREHQSASRPGVKAQYSRTSIAQPALSTGCRGRAAGQQGQTGPVPGSSPRTASAAAARSALARCSSARSGGTNQRDGHSAAARPGMNTSLNSRPFARFKRPDQDAVGVLALVALERRRHGDPGGRERAGRIITFAVDVDEHGDVTGVGAGCDPLLDERGEQLELLAGLRRTWSSAGSPTVSGSGSSPVGRRPTSSSRSSNASPSITARAAVQTFQVLRQFVGQHPSPPRTSIPSERSEKPPG